jgi:diguanylate cyclase (GGDEF)-like protein
MSLSNPAAPVVEPANILVVDDRPENRSLLSAILEPLGQNVVLAESGDEALKQLLRQDFAVILLDVQMPGLDGYETAALIKQRERTRYVPIIFLTAYGPEQSHLTRGYEAGAVDYLFKPFDATILRSKVKVFVELHQLQRQAELLAHRALHDTLTALPNRALFMDRLQVALSRLQRRPGRLGVLYLDLDGFKTVNDTLGHEAGDLLLIEVARRLTAVLRPSDTVARFGGDEFIVLSEGIEEEDAREIAERITAALSEPLLLGGKAMPVAASIGVTLGSGSEQADELIREADAAMYQAKQRGGAAYALYDDPMRARAVRRRQTEVALRGALDRGELCLRYQPHVDVQTGGIVGVEALLRWQHPERGLLSPPDFLDLAEETGLIVPIDCFVLGEAVSQQERWRAEFPDAPPLPISVNVSARHLASRQLITCIERVAASGNGKARTLYVEVSESAVMESVDSAVAMLEELRGMGVGLAIDDFGTGYSSLSYLRQFPVHALKIDPSFVERLVDEPNQRAIVAAIVNLAHAIDLVPIAEGVETPAQLERLREMGCDLAQGNHLAAPQPPEGIAELLAAHGWASVSGAL